MISFPNQHRHPGLVILSAAKDLGASAHQTLSVAKGDNAFPI